MRFYAGIFTLLVALQGTFGYSSHSSSGAVSGASAGAGSFASSGGGAAGQTGTFSSGGTPDNYNYNPGNTGSTGNTYGAQFPYTDNSLGTPYGGGTGGTGGTASYGATAGGGGGAYAGTGAAPFVPPVNPGSQYPPLPSQYDYQNLFINFWKTLNDNYAKLINEQLAHQAALFNQINAAGSRFGAPPNVGAVGGGEGGGGGFYAPNYASASSSYGPQGYHQTANIVPANPNSPNVDTRFGSGQPIVMTSSGQPGYYGVSSSSFSASSDINGQKSSHREAQTSINDNGKVTTYTVRS
uniref:Putative lectin-like domain protein n=1 Tax=Phlebotomus kandelakii TaxID=1109342 RepID=A0A6B2EAX2_9DIPT